MSTDEFDLTISQASKTSGRRRNNFTATTDPTADHDWILGSLDPTHNYEVGSRWINTVDGTVWTCVDSTTGLAAWAQGSGGGSSIDLDWVFVTDHGAVGDDSADDTTAIQAAIDATPQGGVCYFPVPASAYRITASLAIPYSMHLLGAAGFIGQYTKIRQATANTSAIIGPATASQHFVVEGLQITGTIGGQSAGAGIETTQSVLVSRCLIQGFQDGVRITTDGTADEAVYYSTVEDSFVDSGSRAGVYLDGNVNNFTMRGGRVAGNATGIKVLGGPLGARFYGVAIELNTSIGLSVDGTGDSQSTAGVLISGCYFEHDDGLIDVDLGPTTTVYAVTIESCVFVKSGLSGTGWHIDADKVEGLTVSGCYFTSSEVLTTTANTDGIVWGPNWNLNAGTVTLQTGETLILDPAASVSPQNVGSTAAGTSPYPARADHVHGGGSSLTPATTVEAETSFGISPAVGTDTEYARQDHTHGTPTAPSSGGTGPLLLASDHGTPIVFDDILQASDGSDFLYASEP